MDRNYDPNVDYKKLMNDALARGDLTQAAIYEEKRNAKIQGQGLTQYSQTKDYEKYLPQTTQKQMEEVLSKINEREPFSYDFRKDKLYAQYREHYGSTGKAAMEEANAQAAFLTGGYGNSYGATIGKAAYSQEMDKLDARVEDLTEAARKDYDARGEALYEQYDRLSKELADRRERAEALETKEAEQKAQAEKAEKEAREQAEKAEKESKAQAYELVLTMLKSGVYPSDQLLQSSGISQTDAKAMYSVYGGKYSHSGSGGSGSSSGKGSGTSSASSVDKETHTNKDSGSGSDTESTSADTEKTTEKTGKAISNSLWSSLKKAYETGVKSGDLSEFRSLRSSLIAQGYALGDFDQWARSNYGSSYESGGTKIIDTSSVLALGYGPLTERELSKLVEAGIIEQYTYGDYIRYRKKRTPVAEDPVFGPGY
ncbi:MAG: hypothetical protein IKT58_05715 [Oscillospiraceae bacterium]|nr:hypothetical protein [Oscillospiraceae bacterium]